MKPLLLLLALFPLPLLASPSGGEASPAPQLEILGAGVATLEHARTGGHSAGEAGLNFSDTFLSVGAAQRLFDGGIGGFRLGAVTTEQTNGGSSLFLHQALLELQGERLEALVGRAESPSALGSVFPTLREDDLVTLTGPLNPFSHGETPEEHRYANVASLTYNSSLRYFWNLHAQHLPGAGVSSAEGANSLGLSFSYMSSPGLEAFERIPRWSLGYDHATTHGNAPSGLHQAFASTSLRLNESLTGSWELLARDTVSWGSRLSAFSGATDTFKAASNAVAASLLYKRSPFGQAGYRIALTLAHRKYFDVPNASSVGWALTGARQLGRGFDLVAQYQGQWRSASLAGAQSHGQRYEQKAELGLAFRFRSLFNEHIPERRTLLNQRHQYLPN